MPISRSDKEVNEMKLAPAFNFDTVSSRSIVTFLPFYVADIRFDLMWLISGRLGTLRLVSFGTFDNARKYIRESLQKFARNLLYESRALCMSTFFSL